MFNNTQPVVVALTPWMPAIGIDEALTTMIVRSGDAGVRGQVVYQTAEVRPSKPALTWTAIGSTSASGAVATNSVSAGTASNFWIRFGIQGTLASGSEGDGDVGL